MREEERQGRGESEGPASEDAGAEAESGTGRIEDREHEQVSSPELDHLDETIREAKRAADQALTPERDA